MKIPTLLLSPEQSRDRAGNVTLTQSGAVRTVQGQYGKSWFIEELTTNFLINPRFVNFNGWLSQNVERTLIPRDEDAISNNVKTDVVKLTKNSTVASIFWSETSSVSNYTLKVTPGTTYTASYRVKGVAGKRAEMVVFYRDANGYMNVTGGKYTLPIESSNWNTYSITSVAPTGATHVTMMIYLDGNSAANLAVGDTIYVADPQFEQKAYATTYADGTLGTGYQWTGTANASTSIRSAGVVRANAENHFDNRKGSVLVRYKLSPFPAGSLRKYIFSAGNFSTSYGMLGLRRESASSMLISSFVHSQGTYPNAGLSTATGYHTTYIEWDGSHIGWLEGGIGTLNSTTRQKPLEPTPANAIIYVGTYGNESANGEIESIVFFDEPLSRSQREYMAGMTQPWTWDNLMPRIGGTIRTDHSVDYNRSEGIGAYPTLLLKPDTSRDRAGIITPTTSGAIRLSDGSATETKTATPLMLARHTASQDAAGTLNPSGTTGVTNPLGKFASGWQLVKSKTPAPLIMLSPHESRNTLGTLPSLYEETTNLFTNPSVETNLANISSIYVGTTLTQDLTRAYTGTASAKVVLPGVQPYEGIQQVHYTTDARARTITGSVYLRGSGTISVWLRAHYSSASGGGSVEGVIRTVTLSDAWQRVIPPSISITSQQTSNVILFIRTPTTQAITFWADGFQMEEKPYATGYVDGSVAGGTWTGVAHSSTSTRPRGTGLAGATRSVAGSYNPAWPIEEATTNLVPNPRFANSNQGWSFNPANNSMEDDGTLTPSGNVARKTTIASTAGTAYWFRYTDHGTITPGSPYTFRIKVKAREANKRSAIQIVWQDINNVTLTTLIQPSVVLTAGVWTDLVFANQVAPAGASRSYIMIRFETTNAQVGDVYWAGEPQIEAKAYATSYTDGSLGTGYTWTGTADASSSTRAGVVINAPKPVSHTKSLRGSAVARVKLNYDTQGIRYVTQVGETTGNDTIAIRIDNLNRVTLGYRSNGGVFGALVQTSATLPIGQWTTLYIEWDGTNIAVASDSQPLTKGSRGTPAGIFNGVNVGIGNAFNANFLNGDIETLIFFDRPLTNEERLNLTSLTSWDWEELNLPDGEVVVGYEATRNECTNPSMETNVAAWSQSGGGITTITQTNEHAYAGSYSLKAITDGATTVQGFYSSAVLYANTGETWTYSGYVRGAGNLRIAVQERDSVGGLLVETAKEIRTLTGKWERFVVTHTHAHASTARHTIRLTTDTAQAATIYLDAVQIEKKPYATPYADGSLGTDYAWTGTAHQTASTRVSRGSVANTKSVLVRYREGSTDKTAFLKSSGMLGTTGYVSFSNGSLSLSALTLTPIIVESIVTYDKDMSSVQAALFAINAAWTWGTLTTDITLAKPAWFIEEGTTNLILNPSAEVDLGNWGPVGLGVTLERDFTYAYDGRYSVKIVVDGTVSIQGMLANTGITTAAAGTVFTGTAWVIGPAGKQMRILVRENTTNANYTQIYFTATGSWQRAEVKHTLITENAALHLRVDNGATGSLSTPMTFWIDAVQVEQKSYSTNYTPQTDIVGNLLPGYSWTGIPHASTSTRQASAVAITPLTPRNITAHQGSVFVRVNKPNAQSIPANSNIFRFGQYHLDQSNKDYLSVDHGSGDRVTMSARTNGASTANAMQVFNIFAGNPQRVFYAEWDENGYRLYMDNALIASSPRLAPSSGVWYANTLNVGQIGSGGQAFNGSIDNLIAFDRPLSAQERNYLHSLTDLEWTQFEHRINAATREGVAPSLVIARQAGV